MVLEGIFAASILEYYVSDVEYNLGENETDYIPGRFVVMRDLKDKKLKIIALAEEPAHVVIPENAASMYAALKENHLRKQFLLLIVFKIRNEDQGHGTKLSRRKY